MKNELNGWIPVSERLPEDAQMVLVIGDLYTEVTDFIEQSDSNKIGLVKWQSFDYSPCVDTCAYSMWYSSIQFWQPLPKLPEVKL